MAARKRKARGKAKSSEKQTQTSDSKQQRMIEMLQRPEGAGHASAKP